MKYRVPSVWALFFVFLVAAIPALAHHSFAAEFDTAKPIVLKGVISKVDWVNPHIRFYVDVKEDANTTTWALQTGNPSMLRQAGMNKESLGLGQTVTVNAFRAKDGTNLGYARRITYSDGHYFELWFVDPDAPK